MHRHNWDYRAVLLAVFLSGGTALAQTPSAVIGGPPTASSIIGNFTTLNVGDGTNQSVYGVYPPQLSTIALGTNASPTTTAGPVVAISLTETILKEACLASNPNDIPCNAALSANNIAIGNVTSVVSAAFFGATTSSTVSTANAQAINASGRVTGSGIGIGTAAYLEGFRTSTSGKALGAEITSWNNTTVDCVVSTTTIGDCDGIWLTSRAKQPTNYAATALHIARGDPNSMWLEGITFNATSVLNKSFHDASIAGTSIEIDGTHTYAFLAASGAGTVGIGTLTPAGTLEVDGAGGITPVIISAGTFPSADSTHSVISATGTWNVGSGTVPAAAILLNMTDTSSGLGSLIDLQVAASSKFKVNKNGGVTAAGNVSMGSILTFTGLSTISAGSNILNLGGGNVASPVAFSLIGNSTVAGTSNVAGGQVNLTGGLSTGNAGGDVVISTTQSIAAATVQNTALAALTLKGGTQNAVFAAQISATSMTQTAAAQSGTVCQNTAGTLTYDATLGCLASSETLKSNIAPLKNGLATVMALQPINYQWDEKAPKFAADPGVHPGLGAYATAYVNENLIARDIAGNPRGWRQDAVIAELVAAVQELNHKVDRP